MRRAIVWFRNDLRLHDNEALTDALTLADEIIPVFIFDERIFLGKTKSGFDKTGPYRTKFILESVLNLKNRLQELGSDLYIALGQPEKIVAQIARKYKTNWVFCNRERTKEEVDVQDALEKSLWAVGQEIKYYRGKMLFHTADLPFPITHCPDNFTSFRKETEHFVKIRNPFPSPSIQFPKLSVDVDWGAPPGLSDLGHEYFEVEKGISLEGGEDKALALLDYYLWESDNIKNYKKTRNGLLGRDYSTKFSAYLSAGCLSPKLIYHEIKKYEKERGANESTYWLIFELMWRDFFRFIAKKHGDKIFLKGGIRDKRDNSLSNNLELFNLWKSGTTGVPFVDANMRELNESGFMSNRGRQIVASFLIKDLKINWLLGAEYFESLLIDYDPCSNYGNWNYLAGVGTDLRDNRYFNILSQAKKYDPQGSFVKYWIPELKNLPASLIHTPDQLSENQMMEYNIGLGENYPNACFSTKHWI